MCGRTMNSDHFIPSSRERDLVSCKAYMTEMHTEEPCRNGKRTSILTLDNIRSLFDPVANYFSPPGSCITHASQECLNFLINLWLNLPLETRYILMLAIIYCTVICKSLETLIKTARIHNLLSIRAAT